MEEDTPEAPPKRLDLYWFPVSPPARAAVIVLHLLPTTKVHPVLHVIDLFKGEQNTEAFKRISPKGQVPALVEDDYVLIESLAIARYLAHKYQDPLRPIYPNDPRQRGLVEQGLEILRSSFVGNTGIVVYHEFVAQRLGQPGNQDLANKARVELASTLNFIEEFFFKQNEDFLVGNHLTIVDTTFAVYVRHLELVRYDLGPYPKIRQAYEKLKTTDFFKRTHDPLDAMLGL